MLLYFFGDFWPCGSRGPSQLQKLERSGRKKAHKHKLFALVNVQMALGQTAGCHRVNRAKSFMCSSRNSGNINFSLWSTGGLSQGCPGFQKVYVFKVYVPFSCPKKVVLTPLRLFFDFFSPLQPRGQEAPGNLFCPSNWGQGDRNAFASAESPAVLEAKPSTSNC